MTIGGVGAAPVGECRTIDLGLSFKVCAESLGHT